MKKSTAVTLPVFFLLIPATLYLGLQLPGRSYYLTATLIILEILVPFFLAFEGRRPQARELVVVAVLCAIAIASRVALPLPHFKPTIAVIMLAGIAFGTETGFMVGAITALVSNFFVGQGAFTPWQMMAYGAAGLASGFFAQRGWLPRKPWALALFGFFAVMLWVGPLLDVCSLFLTPIQINRQTVTAIFTSGLVVNVVQASGAAATMLLLGRPLLEKLERIQIKYGMLSGGSGKNSTRGY